jgi:tetratricopeptide (TPR) repeat protein
MKSGLWILGLVIVAAVVVGLLLRPRLHRLQEEQKPPEVSELERIEKMEDPQARLSRLREFIAAYPESEARADAFRAIAGTMVSDLEDTTGFEELADRALAEEEDTPSRSEIYFWLYSVQVESEPEAAVETARRLVAEPIETSGIYNYVGYDLAERGLGLDTALELCKKALVFAGSSSDSANVLDSRGWAYYKLGRYDPAVTDLERAAGLFDPPYEEVLRHLVYAALAGGRSDKAFETLKTIMVMGEYDYARAALDSMMAARGYSAGDRAGFYEDIWEERLTEAPPCEAFVLPTLAGEPYRFDPLAGDVAVVSFMSPT